MSDLIRTRVVRDPEHDIVVLTGSLSLASAGTVRDVLRKSLADRGRVVVDVSGLRLAWSPSVELFPAVLNAAGGWPAARLVLCGARDGLERALRLARVTRSVPCESDLDSALDRLHERPERVVRARDLPCSVDSPRDARALVAYCCAEWAVPRLADTGALIVTELVSNAVVHAGTSCRVTVALDGRGLQVAVRDYGQPVAPHPIPIALNAGRGRGLHVVTASCSAWGTLIHRDGKTVWATIAPAADQPLGPGTSSSRS